MQHWKILPHLLAHSLAPTLYSGVFSVPGHCLPFFHAALLFCWIGASSWRWYKYPRWSLWLPWEEGPGERFQHCQPCLHYPNYQLCRGDRSAPKSLFMKDPAVLPPQLQPGPSPTTTVPVDSSVKQPAPPGHSQGWGALPTLAMPGLQTWGDFFKCNSLPHFKPIKSESCRWCLGTGFLQSSLSGPSMH